MRLLIARYLTSLALPFVLVGASLQASPNAATSRCFSETGHCIEGRFLAFWEQNGGEAVFGFPITPARPELNPETETTHLTQWFERHRFELHPENAAPFDVLLGRLGDDRLWQMGVNWRFFTRDDAAKPHYYDETGYAIADVFWDTWRSAGVELGDGGASEAESLALFGKPLSPARTETNGSGDRVLAQWFERARFEYHAADPKTGKAARVLLGRLGAELRANVATDLPAAAPPSQSGLGQLELELVADGLDRPVFVTHAGDGSGRLFVAEKHGTVRVLPSKAVFLDIRDRVDATGAEQGFFSVAFHPGYPDKPHVFVSYTDKQAHWVVSRFDVLPGGQAADPASEQRILYEQDPEPTHNGGMIAFGPDGMLYFGMGDGGGKNDPLGNGQNRKTLFAKILRIDVDSGSPYAIPRDNPASASAQDRREMWAYGLRNPWRFSFDRATGDLYIADVGQDRYDYVYFQADGSKGQNYGWPIVEGPRCLDGDMCDRTGITPPIAAYDHRQGCAAIGGYVYHGERLPLLRGRYLFGDFCSGRIWAVTRNGAAAWELSEALRTGRAISSFGEDETGEVYLVDFGTGGVYRLGAKAAAQP